ncbi:MAG: D-glycero-alpha-D-manno-heptose-1,7-bisphosphate 7-phosphatase [bacterium]
MNKAIFLDRDGVINEYLPNDYVKNSKEFKLINGFKEFIEKHKNFYKFIVITNQAGINKSLVKYSSFVKISLFLIKNFGIEAVYFCPHREEENCNCRKPKNLLLIKATKRFKIDIKNSYFIGDSYTDLLCAKSLNIKFILVLTGKTKRKDLEKWEEKPFLIVNNLTELNLIK